MYEPLPVVISLVIKIIITGNNEMKSVPYVFFKLVIQSLEMREKHKKGNLVFVAGKIKYFSEIYHRLHIFIDKFLP